MPENGTRRSSTVMMPNAIISSRIVRPLTGMVSSVIAVMSDRPPRQSGRLRKQHQHHEHKYHGFGCLGIKVLGQSLDRSERKARNDRTHDRTHAANDHDREHHDD